MKVYHPMGSTTLVMVTPGTFHKDVSDWKDERGNPIRFDVMFRRGVAEVPSNLGNWMIENGLACRTPLVQITNTIKRAFA